VLWARASRGRDVLTTELKQAGADLEEVVVYQNIDVETLPEVEMKRLEMGELDWIGLSSPSIARSLARMLSPVARGMIGTKTRLASISPVTTEAAGDVGLPIAAEAAVYTWDGLFQAIIDAERR
jgi:uroporphyrinogen III methyltransferase/synthase